MTQLEDDRLFVDTTLSGSSSRDRGENDALGADYFMDGEVIDINGEPMTKSDSPNNRHPSYIFAGCGCSKSGCDWYWDREDHDEYADHLAKTHDVQYPPRLIFLYKEKPSYIPPLIQSRKAKPLGKLD